MNPPDVRFGADGLVTGVVQDVADGRVLMVGHLDAEALTATLATGEVHFHSRSRGRLWRKGETSGHVLRLVAVAVDCDQDALLLSVEPVGPTCHRGTRSCFDPDDAPGMNLPVPGGPNTIELAAAIELCMSFERSAALGIASYNVWQDEDGRTLTGIYRVIAGAVRGLAARV